jgi:hypothetical protein
LFFLSLTVLRARTSHALGARLIWNDPYLPLEFAARPKGSQETQAKEILEKYGDKPRVHRNGVGLAVPSGDQVESLRRSVRYLVAVEQVKAKAKQHNLTDEQRGQLREREATEKAAAESAPAMRAMETAFTCLEELHW